MFCSVNAESSRYSLLHIAHNMNHDDGNDEDGNGDNDDDNDDEISLSQHIT